jgi:hypothetical protein
MIVVGWRGEIVEKWRGRPTVGATNFCWWREREREKEREEREAAPSSNSADDNTNARLDSIARGNNSSTTTTTFIPCSPTSWERWPSPSDSPLFAGA